MAVKLPWAVGTSAPRANERLAEYMSRLASDNFAHLPRPATVRVNAQKCSTHHAQAQAGPARNAVAAKQR
ncbi:MAG: hypothetical protein JRD89_02325 [Deltaproteobacteria bacterium]|nr:hypothetical protein [Deltaproteobacteria bacterium]